MNCREAHGEEELSRRLPPSPPPSFHHGGMQYYDAHCHLDGMILARRYGYHWPFKTKLCRSVLEVARPCAYGKHCFYAHSQDDLRQRPKLGHADLVELFRSFPAGCGGLVHNCCDGASIEQTLQLVQWGRESFGGRIYATFGLHPTDYYTYSDELVALFLDAFEQCGDRAVAWGECGLDYYRKPSDEEKVEMVDVFVQQLQLAVGRRLPLVIHSRDAEDDVVDVLRDHVPRDTLVHLHSFSGSLDTLMDFLDEFPRSFFGANGAVTYPGEAEKLAELARCVPLDRMLLETDGPYMIPEPFRFKGGGSHAGHIPWIAQRVADIKAVPLEVVLAQTQANVCAMYGIDSEVS